MAFKRPTLAELVGWVQQDFVSRLELKGSPLRRALVVGFSRAMAGAAHMLHGHLEYLGQQLFPDTADKENLRKFGTLHGVTPTEATFATGNVIATGADTSPIPSGSKLIRSDGAEYETDADAVIASGTATISVTALVAGENGNCDAGVELTFESPVAGVDSTATVDTGLGGGADEEADDDYLVRVLERLQNPPQGGSSTDYVAWAKEVAGVTRVWVDPGGNGAGSVVVRFMRDDDADPIPDASAVATVQAHLDEVRPVTAAVTAAAPIADALNFTISVTPNTVDVQAAVRAELADLLSREAEPGATLLLSHIRTAIGSADGLDDYTLTSPAADVAHDVGHVATLGTITWA